MYYHVPNHDSERSCITRLGISILTLSVILLLNFGTFSTQQSGIILFFIDILWEILLFVLGNLSYLV